MKRARRHMGVSSLLGVVMVLVLLLSTSCSGEETNFEIADLRPNASGYYDAVLKVRSLESVHQGLPLHEFEVSIWERDVSLGELTLVEEGGNPAIVDEGDTFIVPLIKPESKLSICVRGDYTRDWDYVWWKDFWEMIPESDRLCITDSEAMKVARSIKLVSEKGVLKPSPSFLPFGWERVEDEPGSLRYEKRREGVLVEEVRIFFGALDTGDERLQLKTADEITDYLLDDMKHRTSPSLPDIGATTINGNPAVYGSYGRGGPYSLVYFESGVYIDVEVQSDHYEWARPPGE